MDKLRALSIYIAAYRAHATQLAASRIARVWMESMDFRSATREQLEEHAVMAASWANHGYLPEEALPLIASGMTPQLASAADPTTEAERMERLADLMRMLRD